jgi:monoamine oxidase
METIKKWYPNAPNYVSYKRSNWGADPYSLGSYPFVKAGASTNDCSLYRESKSTGNKVYFAGDGTTCLMIGTVHGAYITGVEAAQAIVSKPPQSKNVKKSNKKLIQKAYY